MTLPRHAESEVLSNREIRPGVFLTELHAPWLAARAKPGQFLMVRPAEGTDPLLPRPFSIHDRRNGSIFILFRSVGRGTGIMAGKPMGSAMHVIGPLGRGFDLGSGGYRPILVAGGMGLAPMPALARELRSKGLFPKLLYGCRSKGELVRLKGLKADVSTEDGSCGLRGRVTAMLAEELKRRGACRVFACGPWAMLRRVAKMCLERETYCQVSLEARMACGVGACQGCAVKSSDGNYLTVCSDGPVFDSRLIDWDQEPPL